MAFPFFKTKAEKDRIYLEKAQNELVHKLNSIQRSDLWPVYARNLVSGGNDFGDRMHDIYQDFGYPQTVDIRNYINMWRRFGVAKAVVESPPKVSWLRPPLIKSENEQFENEVALLIEKLNLWQRLKGLDIRQRIGRYGGLFVRVRGGKSLDTEVGQLSGVESLVNLQPMDESQLEVNQVDTDQRSENFGEPIYYQFDSTAVGNRNELLGKTFKIHPSRVIIAAEGADDGSIYGISSLEAVYND